MFTTVFTVLIASLAIGFAVSPSAGRELLPDGSQRHPPLWIMDLPQSSGILMPGL